MDEAGAWLLVAADFVKTGGMDRANYALADYLTRRGREVHLVGHAAAPGLLSGHQLHWHRVRRPLGRDALGWGPLNRAGRSWARQLNARGGRVLVNGGNCRWGDVNWVHYVHAAYRSPLHSGNPLTHAWHGWKWERAQRDEHRALAEAQWVVANSERTRRDLIQLLQVPPERVQTIYYGCDAERFRPVQSAGRAAARRALGWDPGRRTALFIGALGDRRKGFDTLWTAWQRLCTDATWDVDLVVAGRGAELAAWRRRVAAAPQAHCTLLGFRSDIPALLAASDVLVAPTRYEAYGLGVQEALAAGLPALVSAEAGVAERLPPELHCWRLQEPESALELEQRLRVWRQEADAPANAPWRVALASLSQQLRARTWDTMAAEIVALREGE